MKIILLITVCNQNKARIFQQLGNLRDATVRNLVGPDLELVPIFVFGKGGDSKDIPYTTMTVDVNERYENLYLKLFQAYENIHGKYSYDFIWKIDDDTKINFEALDLNLLKDKDYVGRMMDGSLDARIRIDLDFCNLHKDIVFKPPFLSDRAFRFATGDSYFLSHKAVECLIQQKPILNECVGHRINEDRLVGYLLADKGLVVEDIMFEDDVTKQNELQVSKGYLSIHPISVFVYTSLVGQDTTYQLQRLTDNQSVNLLRRKAYVQELEDKIRQTVMDFINSKKSIGIG